jgi:HEPN domain-containing protein
MSDMADRSRDWFRQAERDMQQAALSRDAEHHEWCCFVCQQAAEKAVKALHLARGQEAWGHVVAKLLAELPAGEKIPADLSDKARVLDAYYVAPRYPNGHPEGAPFEHYGKLHSDQAIEYAHEIIELVRSRLA